MSTNESIEQEIQAKGLTAPRVAPKDIEDAIKEEHFFTGYDGAEVTFLRALPDISFDGDEALKHLTICILVLHNGYTVVGTSACVSAANFDAEIGKRIARTNAVDQLWGLFGFELAQRLHRERVAAEGEGVEHAP